MSFKTIGTWWNRENRNAINNNFVEIFDTATSINNRITNLILESGQSNMEVVDARGDYSTLGKRFNSLNEKLGEKANKNELDALGELKLAEQHDTVADLEAKYPEGESGLHLVIADGYVYRWGGSSWIQAVQFQTSGIGNRTVDYIKTSFLNSGKNLLNPSQFTTGKSVDRSTGNLVDFPDAITSGFTYVDPSTEYTPRLLSRYAFYDSNQNFISGGGPDTLTPGADGESFTTPSNAALVRISWRESSEFMQLEEGGSFTGYEPYHLKTEKVSAFTREELRPINSEFSYNADGTLNKVDEYVNGVLVKSTSFIYENGAIASVTEDDKESGIKKNKSFSFTSGELASISTTILGEGN